MPVVVVSQGSGRWNRIHLGSGRAPMRPLGPHRGQADECVIGHHGDGEVHAHQHSHRPRRLTLLQDVEVGEQQDNRDHDRQSEEEPPRRGRDTGHDRPRDTGDDDPDDGQLGVIAELEVPIAFGGRETLPRRLPPGRRQRPATRPRKPRWRARPWHSREGDAWGRSRPSRDPRCGRRSVSGGTVLLSRLVRTPSRRMLEVQVVLKLVLNPLTPGRRQTLVKVCRDAYANMKADRVARSACSDQRGLVHLVGSTQPAMVVVFGVRSRTVGSGGSLESSGPLAPGERRQDTSMCAPPKSASPTLHSPPVARTTESAMARPRPAPLPWSVAR